MKNPLTRRQFIVLGGFAVIGAAFTASRPFPTKMQYNVDITYYPIKTKPDETRLQRLAQAYGDKTYLILQEYIDFSAESIPRLTIDTVKSIFSDIDKKVISLEESDNRISIGDCLIEKGYFLRFVFENTCEKKEVIDAIQNIEIQRIKGFEYYQHRFIIDKMKYSFDNKYFYTNAFTKEYESSALYNGYHSIEILPSGANIPPKNSFYRQCIIVHESMHALNRMLGLKYDNCDKRRPLYLNLYGREFEIVLSERHYNETLAITAEMIYALRYRYTPLSLFSFLRCMDNNRNTYHHNGYDEIFRFVWDDFIRRKIFYLQKSEKYVNVNSYRTKDMKILIDHINIGLSIVFVQLFNQMNKYTNHDSLQKDV